LAGVTGPSPGAGRTTLSTPLEEYWQTFADLKREGKVRAIGLSNHNLYQLEEAAGIANVDAIQPPFSLIHRDAADDVLLWAREHVTGVIVYSPMASGLLSGAFTAARAAAIRATGAGTGPTGPEMDDHATDQNEPAAA
jgi:aryl-alcohol dehydrogenase-like predicted oxidoreductase